jgi:Ser/Thr protein kinase RdoA (MazF antagonist)
MDMISDTEALIANLCLDYPLTATTACRLLHEGFNTHYLITTSSDDFVLRVYQPDWRTNDDIAYELAVLTHLAARGVPVCAPIARRDGTYINTIVTINGPCIAVLFQCAAGEPLDPHNPKVLHDYGRIMAHIHQETDGFSCQFQHFHLDLDHLIAKPLNVVLPLLSHRPADATFVQDIARVLHSGIAAQSESLEWGYCHGDFAGNAHQDVDGSLRVFDFDCGGPGWRAYDLAVCRLFSDIGGLWEEFCAGYQEIRPITAATHSAIPWFLVVRQFWRIGLFATHLPRLTGMPVDDAFFDQHLTILRERIAKQLPDLSFPSSV